MPIYEFTCNNPDCNTISFEIAVAVKDITVDEKGHPHYVVDGKPPVCPGCGKKRISRVYGGFHDRWIGGKPSTGG